MEMSGERLIAAPRAEVWRALNDPEVLKACIPGCQEMEKTSETTFAATVKQKVGPVNATFKGAVELTDIVEGESYRISGEGKGGAAGFAKGGAAVRLEDAEAGTRLSYDAEAKVGGKLAQLGARLIDGFAKKMADQFFDRFKARLEPEDAPDPEAEDAAPASATATATAEDEGAADPIGAEAKADTTDETKKKGWFSRLIGS